jgi:hypothetical protein
MASNASVNNTGSIAINKLGFNLLFSVICCSCSVIR